MKPLHGRLTSSQSCSCTSCSKSGSNHPLYKEFIAKGSKIDKLFLEEFIPLHERKLLGKLVRTRAVYDDIRNELLSGSDLSVRRQPDLKPNYMNSDSNGSEKIGALLELVNLVDKGATLGPRRSSDCCSCCSCGSANPLDEREGRSHTHRHRRAHISSRSSILSRKAKDERRPGKLRRKTKHIHSDPCTCTSKLSGLIAKESKAVIGKLRAHMPKSQPGSPLTNSHELSGLKAKDSKASIIEKLRANIPKSKQGSPPFNFVDINQAIKDYKMKHAGMGEIIRKSLTKVRLSKSKLSYKIKDGTKQSLEKIKKTEYKIKNKIGDGVRKSKKSKPVIAPLQNVYENENMFDIKKDSLMKYRDEMDRKKLLKEYECAFGCNPEECEPIECLKIINQNKNHKKDRLIDMMNDLNKHHNQNLKEDTMAFEYGVQAQTSITNAKTATKDMVEKNKSKEINAKISTKNQAVKNKTAEKTVSRGLNLKRCYCTLKLKPTKKVPNRSGIGQNTNISQSVHSISKSLQTSKEPYLPPDECAPGFCVPDKCDPIECLKRIRKRRKNYSTTSNTKAAKFSSKSTPSLKLNIPVRSRSSGGSKKLNSKSSQQINLADTFNKSPNDKQAVRISSNFSFNIEFSKNSQNSQIPIQKYAKTMDKNDDSKQPHFKTNKRKPQMSSKQSSTNQRTKSQGSTFKSLQKSTQAKNTFGEVLGQSAMKRCFCTLNLRKMGKNTKLNLTSTGTKTALSKEEVYPRIEMATKSTRMKNKNRVTRQLKDYECEPEFCIPGQCDPHQCLERIKIRDISKSKEFGGGTDATRMKSTSSGTGKHKNGKDAISQSRDKVHMKRYNYTLPGNGSEISLENLQKNPSRQAVRIGSNFSFNIEFSKSRTSNKHGINQQVIDKPKTTYNKVENNHKNGRQSTAQTGDIKTINEASETRPVLKKCFCTLKLQNKRLSKNAPTVMPVIIKKHTLCTPIKKDLIPIHYDKRGINICSTRFSSTSSKTSFLNSESDFDIRCCELSSRKLNMNRFCTIHSKQSLVSKIDDQATYIGARQFMKSNFYAMNIQVKNKRKVSYKLKPYECEPGICIPGECNPIECQKLIMKRLMKKASTMTNSMKRSQSISSNTADSKPKKQQSNQASTNVQKLKKENQGIKYKTMPRSQKQAVRVGSSFSFNIEFYKDKKTTQQQVQRVPKEKVMKSKKSEMQKSTSTIKHINKNSDSTYTDVRNQSKTSQSTDTMKDKGSNVKLKLQRCFCTLKLQKKGKQNKHIRLATDKKSEIKKEVIKTTDASQNTKKNKPYSLPALDPNECEPNVCIPGECDPYKCLERIKRRGIQRNTKDSGTDMKKTQGLSTSSMTTSKKNVARGKQAKFKDKPVRIVKTLPKTYKPSRQAVRIGSNFGFNVEFFKEKSYPDESTTRMPLPRQIHHETKSQYNETVVNLKSQAIQDSKSIRHQDSQVIVPAQHEKSTKTESFLKRCFCTLNLHGKETLKKFKTHNATAVKHKPNPETGVQSKLQYFATKMKQKPKKDPELNRTASVQTKVKKEKPNIRKLNLEPYECEPGVCVPGECDPRICAERIAKRNAIHKMSSTEGSGTASVATLYQSPKLVKSSYAQNKTVKDKTQIKPLGPKQLSNIEHSSIAPERNVVRIGSNFSFNIEFYKEKFPTFDNVQKAAKKIKEQRKLKAIGTKTNPNAKPIGVHKITSQQSNDSQTHNVITADKASTVSPMLKRCFCTLSLQKDKKEKDIIKHDAKIEIMTKSTETPKKMYKAYKLEPNECEPGVCIPGQCNPHECLKRIQKRMQSKMSNTEAPKGRQVTTLTAKPESAKTTTTLQKQTHKTQNASNFKTENKNPSKYPINKNRQAVRIGSNFSFNIDFFKDTNLDNANKIKLRQPHSTEKITATKSNNNKNVALTYQTKVIDRQLQSQNHKTESKASEAGHLMKRCFCTLKLQKVGRQHASKTKKPIRKVSKTSQSEINKLEDRKISKDVSTRTKEKRRILDPYECEPNFCVPGQCEPLKCYERIKSRDTNNFGTDTVRHSQESKETGIAPYLKRCFCTLTLHKTKTNTLQLSKCKMPCPRAQNKATSTKINESKELDPNECEPGTCIPGQCDPYRCLEKIKQRGIHRQSRNTGTRSDRSRYNSKTTSNCEPGCKSRGFQSDGAKITSVVEEPRFPLLDRKNWQGLKMGSNISVCIEFYKEQNLIPLLQKKYNSKKSILHSIKPVNTQSQKLTNKASIVSDAMKRCFFKCQQHKNPHNNIVTVERLDNIFTQSPFKTQTTCYNCNCLERIMLGKQKNKTMNKKINTKYVDSAIMSKRLEKIDKDENRVSSSSNVHKESNKRKIKASGVVNTILPYTPNKFNKHESKTLISHKDLMKGAENYCHDETCKNKPKHAKRLTKKEGTKLLHQEPTSGPKQFLCNCLQVFSKSRDVKTYIHTNADRFMNSKRDCNSDNCPGILKNNTQKFGTLKSAIKLKNKRITQKEKKDSLQSGDTVQTHHDKLAPLYKGATCPHCQHLIEKLLNKSKQEQAKSNPKSFQLPNSQLKHVENKSCPCAGKYTTYQRTQLDGAKVSINAKSKRRKHAHDNNNRSSRQQTEGYSILQFGDSAQTGNSKLEQIARFSNKKLICPHCQENINEGQTVEIKYQGPIIERAISNIKLYKNRVSTPKERLITTVNNQSHKNPNKEIPISNRQQAKKIMNPFVVFKNFISLKLLKKLCKGKEHKQTCPCCACKAKSQLLEAKDTNANDVTIEKDNINPSDVTKDVSTANANDKTIAKTKSNDATKGKTNVNANGVTKKMMKFNTKNDTKAEQNNPCVCGSKLCEKESKKQKISKTDTMNVINKLKTKKRCVCGSPVCAKELKKIAKSKTTGKKSLNTCLCDVLCQCHSTNKKEALLKKKTFMSIKRKQRAKIAEHHQAELRKRQKIYKKDDKKRRRERRKKDAKMFKAVLKSKEAGDCMLLADSLIDIAKLSCTTLQDVARSTFRAVRDPRRTADNLKALYNDPERACDTIKSGLGESGIASTLKRIKMRIAAMGRVQGTMTKLEEYAVTNYLVHACDKDPKKKHHPRKKKKTRVPLDFQCSPYMASLRKKPWLSVYYSCPWFYPHCISLLNVWKQFTDICLFLLAVVVWSPCIFLMEACRGAMCCMLCTG